MAIKGKIKSALVYPISIIVVAFVIVAVIMIFVIPAFKTLFDGFGADLPAPTLLVMAISEFFVSWWWAIFGAIGLAYGFSSIHGSVLKKCNPPWIDLCLNCQLLVRSLVKRPLRALRVPYLLCLPLAYPC